MPDESRHTTNDIRDVVEIIIFTESTYYYTEDVPS
jgi:hypothetical protein